MSAAPLRARQVDAGATFATVEGVDVARHYGAAADEYRAVREGAGLVVRTDRAHLRVWGRDPVRMLNGLVTNDLGLMDDERAVYSAMLTPKGRVITDLLSLRRKHNGEDEVLVELPAAASAATTEHLKKYVPPLFARWEALGAEVSAVGVYGPRSAELLSEALELPVAPEQDRLTRARYRDAEIIAIATRYAGGETGFNLVGDEEVVAALWDDLLRRGESRGIQPVGWAALEALRIEAGQPRYRAEITEEVLPAEVFESTGRMERAVSFTKGCYTGQEVVVRIAHRGHVNRLVRGLLMGETAAPAAKTPLLREDGEKEVGWITSTTQSPLMGQTVGLGFVRREIAPGERVRVGSQGEATAEVVALPFSV